MLIELSSVLFGLGFTTMLIGAIISIKSEFGSDSDYMGLLIVILGGVIAISGAFTIPNYTEDFCEDQNGIYEFSNQLKLCSLQDAQGDYVVYQVLKVDKGEYELARFSNVPQGGQR